MTSTIARNLDILYLSLTFVAATLIDIPYLDGEKLSMKAFFLVVSVTKTRKDNNVTDHIGVIFEEYNIELSRLKGQCAVYDEDKTRQ